MTTESPIISINVLCYFLGEIKTVVTDRSIYKKLFVKIYKNASFVPNNGEKESIFKIPRGNFLNNNERILSSVLSFSVNLPNVQFSYKFIPSKKVIKIKTPSREYKRGKYLAQRMSHMAYRNSWTLVARVGRWALEAELWTLDSGRWTLGDGLWTLDSGRWTLNAALEKLGSGH